MNYDEGINKILDGLKKYDGYYSKDYYIDFETKTDGMKERIEESFKEGRLLRIGIVGEIKAGKSSFLNSLIFDGKDLLPKASTPMTAALTKISYSQNSFAKIVFYSQKDWEKVEKYAKEYEVCLDNEYQAYCSRMNDDNMLRKTPLKIQTKEEYKSACIENIPVQYRSCRELMDLYEKSSVDLGEWLGKEKEINCSNLGEELDEYIGAEGKYTSIVKHVELGMDNELLEGIEIIDTPGMNDPIVSRGETTKKFLRDCDVVFLLSYSGQFLTQEDISFMVETMPREGVKNIVIIGSKLDSGVLDNSKFTDFNKVVAFSKKLYNEQAQKNIEECIKAGNNLEIIKKIQESLPPYYISSLMYDVARKKSTGIPLEEYELNIIEQCKKRFEGFSEEEKFLLKLSGIGAIRSKKLREVKDNKAITIAEKNKTIVEDNKHSLMELLSQISIQVHDNYLKVKNGDIDSLEKKLQAIQNNLNSMRNVVKNIFEKYKLEAIRILTEMENEIELEINNHTGLSIQESSKTEYSTIKTGIFKKEVIQELVITKSASVSDAISNMRNYIARCKQMTNDTFSKAVNINKLKKDIKEVVLQSFEMSNQEFNENDILIPLDLVAGKISIPKIEIEMDSYENMLVDSFSNSFVIGEEIENLKLEMNRTLTQICKKLKTEILKCKTNVENIMGEQSIVFVDNIIKTLNENVKLLKSRIQDKEESIRKYEELMNLLLEYTNIIKNLEM